MEQNTRDFLDYLKIYEHDHPALYRALVDAVVMLEEIEDGASGKNIKDLYKLMDRTRTQVRSEMMLKPFLTQREKRDHRICLRKRVTGS